MFVGIGDIRKSKGLSKSFHWDEDCLLEGIRLTGPLHLDLKVTNAGSRVMVVGPLRAQVLLDCSRCSEEFAFPVKTRLEEEFLPAGSEEARARAGDMLDGALTFENDKVVLDELLRQEIEAALPIQILCRPDCRGLCTDCGSSLNHDPGHRCQSTSGDSRWDALKNWSPGSQSKN